jgi:hypothetical protein
MSSALALDAMRSHRRHCWISARHSYNCQTVPLSEREQEILAEIEKRLSEDDPRLARHVSRRALRARTGLFLFLAGFVLLLGFFFSGSVPVGVAAFGAMVVGIVLLLGALGSLLRGRGPNPWVSDMWAQVQSRLRRR